MTNHDPIESGLERLSEVVSLRTDEKDAHRESLKAFMVQTRRPVASPYAWLFGRGAQVVAGLLVLTVVSGGGIASAAGNAKPGDPLYYIKLRITEPAQTALIFDKEKKTKATLERADKRLKEFALAAASENPDPETTALITESLSENIAEVAEDVALLSASGEADTALATNADLQSMLSAHSSVLEVIEEKNPTAAEDVQAITASVENGIAATENTERALVDALEPTLTTDEPVVEQAVEAEVSLSELLTHLETQSASLSDLDRTVVAEDLSEINEIIAEAWAARELGNRKEAYLLYNEANQRLEGLQTLVEADRDLGIGVVNEVLDIEVEN